jgi:putative aldouronate transport system permease protein
MSSSILSSSCRLFIVLYPLYFVVIASFSDPFLVNSGEVLFIPKGISADCYRYSFQ